ncbi:MAG TPA: O-antigen ligase family protein [Myxococcales bacterium]
MESPPAPAAAPAPDPVATAVAEPAPLKHSRWATAAAAIVGVWAVGSLGLEGVEQAAAGAALVMALATFRRVRLAEDLRLFALLTVGLAAYQALSPFLALALGTSPELPRSGRWTQALDALAPLSLAIISTFGVPWRLLFWGLGVGWLLETAVGLFQVLVKWPWESWGPLKFPLHRLHQNYAPEEVGVRRPGLGLFFHKLKFAHEALAFLGTSLAFALRPGPRRRRAIAAGLSVALLGCTYLSYARAALAAALLIAFLGLAAMLPGKARLAGLLIVALGLGTVTLSPTWKVRLDNAIWAVKSGERAQAWGIGWKAVQDHPVLGAGFGNYVVASRPYRDPSIDPVLYTSAHNVAMTVLAETGIIGLLLYLAQQLALGLALWRRSKAGSIVAAGGLLSLLAFHFVGLSHYIQFHSGVALAFALVWGLGLAPNAPGMAAAAPAPAPAQTKS